MNNLMESLGLGRRFYLFAGIGFFVLSVLLIVWIISLLKKRKKLGKQAEKTKSRTGKTKHLSYRERIQTNLRKIKGKHFAFIISGVLILGLLIGGNLTGFTLKGGTEENKISVFWFVLITGFLGLMVFAISKNLSLFKSKYLKNSINNLLDKEVYLTNGDYLGKIEEVILHENKIDKLQIGIDKKNKLGIKPKGIFVNYKQVKSVGDAAIISEKILGCLDTESLKT
jgi:sporulation protein YlmC with PRC-barrel domain